MKLEKIKAKLIPIIEPYDLFIYSIKTKREFNEDILEILLDGARINSDMLEAIHLKLQSELTDDELDPNYYLELSSVGIERPITTPEEIEQAIGRYVYLESQTYRGNGTLIDFKDDILKLEINQKGRIRKIDIGRSSVNNMRYAVKF